MLGAVRNFVEISLKISYLLKLVERYNNSESYEGEDVIDLQRVKFR